MIVYSWPIVTTCESVSAILVSLTDFKAVAVVGITFSGILIDLVFPVSTITVVVIMLHSEVSGTYKY